MTVLDAPTRPPENIIWTNIINQDSCVPIIKMYNHSLNKSNMLIIATFILSLCGSQTNRIFAGLPLQSLKGNHWPAWMTHLLAIFTFLVNTFTSLAYREQSKSSQGRSEFFPNGAFYGQFWAVAPRQVELGGWLTHGCHAHATCVLGLGLKILFSRSETWSPAKGTKFNMQILRGDSWLTRPRNMRTWLSQSCNVSAISWFFLLSSVNMFGSF